MSIRVHSHTLRSLYIFPVIVEIFNSWLLRWSEHVARIKDKKIRTVFFCEKNRHLKHEWHWIIHKYIIAKYPSIHLFVSRCSSQTARFWTQNRQPCNSCQYCCYMHGFESVSLSVIPSIWKGLWSWRQRMHNLRMLWRNHGNEIRLHGLWRYAASYLFYTTQLRIRAVMNAVCYNFMNAKFQEFCSEGHWNNRIREFRDSYLSHSTTVSENVARVTTK
jgi:hypothetical protein